MVQSCCRTVTEQGQYWEGGCVNVSCVNECVLPCCPAEDLSNLSFIHGSDLVLRSDSGVDFLCDQMTKIGDNSKKKSRGGKKKKAHISRFIK